MFDRSLIFIAALASSYFAIFSQGFATVVQGADLSDSKEELAATFGYSDSGSYLKAAIDLESFGEIRPDFFWVYNLWPPGMPFLEALLIRLEPLIPFPLAYAHLIWILWSMLLAWLGWMIRRQASLIYAIAFIALSSQLTPFSDWIFGYGLFYAEGISSLFFLTGLVLFIRGTLRHPHGGQFTAQSIRIGVLVGLSFGAAAYFRASFSVLLQAGIALLILGAIILLLNALRVAPLRLKSLFQAGVRRGVIPMTALATMAAVMLPWQVFASNAVRPGDLSWSTVSGSFIAGTWADRTSTASFLAEGGVGWACHLDPVQCREISELMDSSSAAFDQAAVPSVSELGQRALFVALNNPIEFVSDRFHFFMKGWFASETGIGIPANSGGFVNAILLGVFLVALRPHLQRGYYELLAIPLLAASQVVPLIIGHVEPRYFIPIKLLILCLPALLDVPSAEEGEFQEAKSQL